MVIELNDINYVDFIENTNKVTFIDFYSPYCPPCVESIKALDILDSYYDGQVNICKINVLENPKLSNKYRVSSTPLSLVIGADKMVKEAEIGLKPIDIYTSMIDREFKSKDSIISKFISIFKK
jgi:thioredoxin 1